MTGAAAARRTLQGNAGRAPAAQRFGAARAAPARRAAP